MNHVKILKESLQLVLKHKYLWFLGILLGTGSGMNWYSFNGGDSDIFKQQETGKNVASLVSANVKDAGAVLGDKISASMNNSEWVLIAFFVLLLIVLLLYLYITTRGAITWAVIKLHNKEKFSLRDAWETGHKFFWRRLSYDILICASMIVIMAVLSIPIILLAIFELTIPAVILGIIFALAFIALAIYLSLFLPYSERILFLENKKPLQAIAAGYKLFNKNWLNLVLMYLILLAIGIAVAIAFAFAFIICAALAFGIGSLFYYANHILGYTIGGIIGAATIIAFIIVGGALQAFNWSSITLAYRETK